MNYPTVKQRIRVLTFQHRGEWFVVNEKGEIVQEVRFPDFSSAWLFRGVSFHHWRNGIDVRFHKEMDAALLEGGIVWDLDHQSTRTWLGRFNGKIPRVTKAYWTHKEVQA